MDHSSLIIVDDDVGFVRAASAIAAHKGFDITIAGTLDQARTRLQSKEFDLVVIDLSLPDGNGLDLLEHIDLGRRTQVIVITGTPTVESALKALHLPLLDYVLKPLNATHFSTLLDRANKSKLPPRTAVSEKWRGMVTASKPMAELKNQLVRVAKIDASVFLEGESGVGKEMVANAIHEESGRTRAFVALNCGAVPPELLTSQLFGHERGSFTGACARHIGLFEQASGGTLFLDELTEMPTHLQVHLLRALETKKIRRVGGLEDFGVDVRVISATNRPYKTAIAEGRLREDLYYRLAEFHLLIPPLRERPDDILCLAEFFLQKLNAKHLSSRALSQAGVKVLENYNWPGNVRELKNIIQRAYVMADDNFITPVIPADRRGPVVAESADTISFPIGLSMHEVEKQLLLKTLEYFDQNKAKSAEVLGITTKTIHNKLAAYVVEHQKSYAADLA